MKHLNVFTLSLIATVLVMAGCVVGNTSTSNANNAATTSTQIKTYQVGVDAPAGDIVHHIVSAEKIDTIPASATLLEWQSIAEPLPATTGNTWVHVLGTVTNNSLDSQVIDSTSLYVTDAKNNVYHTSTDTTIYVAVSASPTYLIVPAEETAHWEGYFQIPKTAKKLALHADDLSFFPKAEVLIDLGM